MSLLNVESLGIGFDRKIIDDLSFEIYGNNMVAFLCPNGQGKSTFIKALSGYVPHNEGKIVLDGIRLTKRNLKKYMLKIGAVYENIDEQFLTNAVVSEIRFPLIHLCYDRDLINERVQFVSEIVKVDKILHKEISSLSMFDKIKVLIATSIAHFPKLLLLDDVFRFLNKRDKDELFKILNSIREELNISILFTTSSIDDVIDLDNILVFADKNKKLYGDFKEIVIQDNELAKIGLEIPIMIDLSRKLQFYDLLDDIYYDVDVVVNKLWK